MKEQIFNNSFLKKRYESILTDELANIYFKSSLVKIHTLKIYDLHEFGEPYSKNLDVAVYYKKLSPKITQEDVEKTLSSVQPFTPLMINWKAIAEDDDHIIVNAFNEYFLNLQIDNQERIDVLINKEYRKYLEDNKELSKLKEKIPMVVLDDYSYACDMTKNELYMGFEYIKNYFSVACEYCEDYDDIVVNNVIPNPCTRHKKILYGQEMLDRPSFLKLIRRYCIATVEFEGIAKFIHDSYCRISDLHKEIGQDISFGNLSRGHIVSFLMEESDDITFDSFTKEQKKLLYDLRKKYKGNKKALDAIDELERLLKKSDEFLERRIDCFR